MDEETQTDLPDSRVDAEKMNEEVSRGAWGGREGTVSLVGILRIRTS